MPQQHKRRVTLPHLVILCGVAVLGGLAVLGGIALLGGPQRGLDAADGTLEIRITDHREAIGDFARLDLTLKTLRVRPRGGLRLGNDPSWTVLPPAVDSVDVTAYTEGRSVAVFRGPMPPGTFEALHLQLQNVVGELKQSGTTVSVADHSQPIRLSFQVRAHTVTRIVVDFVVLDMRDHRNRGYELHVRGYALYRDDTLLEKVPPG